MDEKHHQQDNPVAELAARMDRDDLQMRELAAAERNRRIWPGDYATSIDGNAVRAELYR